MSEYRRANIKGGTYFFTVVTHQRQKLLLDDGVRVALREGIEKTRTTFPFQIIAWVLLPDHLHCIWTLPDGDADFSKRWGMIKRHVSQHCAHLLKDEDRPSPSQLKRHESNFWQRRYWEHQIRDEADMARHVDYIHWNPMKHGLVDRVSDWPYSTFHRYVAQDVYPKSWCGSGGTELNDAEFGE
jgi:putative transposase